jgi:hypothetical protein
MKASAGRDLTVGGASLAAHAVKAGLVDECHPFVPIVVRGGKRSLPDNVRVELERLDDAVSADGWFTSATTPARKGDGEAARNRGDVSPRPRVPARRQRY